jgi:hypothetical protein
MDGRLSGSFTNKLRAKSATHCISCCKLWSVDGSTVNSLASKCIRTLSTSVWPSAITFAKESAGLLSWLLTSLGRSKLLKEVEMLWSIMNWVKSLAFDWPWALNLHNEIFMHKCCTKKNCCTDEGCLLKLSVSLSHKASNIPGLKTSKRSNQSKPLIMQYSKIVVQ